MQPFRTVAFTLRIYDKQKMEQDVMIRYVRAYQTANGRNSTFTMTTVSKPKKARGNDCAGQGANQGGKRENDRVTEKVTLSKFEVL